MAVTLVLEIIIPANAVTLVLKITILANKFNNNILQSQCNDLLYDVLTGSRWTCTITYI